MTDSLNTNAALQPEELEEHTRQAAPEETPQTENLDTADMENEKAATYELKHPKPK